MINHAGSLSVFTFIGLFTFNLCCFCHSGLKAAARGMVVHIHFLLRPAQKKNRTPHLLYLCCLLWFESQSG